MSNRFEIVLHENVKEAVGSSGYMNHSIYVFRDKETNMLYLETSHGLTPLLDKNGKPMSTTYQVSI